MIFEFSFYPLSYFCCKNNKFNNMRLYLLFVLLSLYPVFTQATDTVYVHETQLPILIERKDNVFFLMRLTTDESDKKLNEVALQFDSECEFVNIQSVKLYYGGTEARQNYGKDLFAPVVYIPRNDPGKTLAANRSYSIKKHRWIIPGGKCC